MKGEYNYSVMIQYTWRLYYVARCVLKMMLRRAVTVNIGVVNCKGDEQEKSRDRNYKRTRRFQGRIAGNNVMFWRFL